MKKFIFLVFLLIGFQGIKSPYANPVWYPPPQAFISEITFSSGNSWTIELEMYLSNSIFLINGIIDSIVIQSNEGRARVLSYPLAFHQLFLVNQGGTNVPLSIDPTMDTIRVITYANPILYPYGPPENMHVLVYGYPDCEIPVFNQGQSICSRENLNGVALYFYLDNSPTLGIANDTIGASLTLLGHFYDCRDSLITYNPYNPYCQNYFTLPINIEPYTDIYGSFSNFLDVFNFNNQGFYSTTLLARNGTTSNISILYCFYGWCNSYLMPCGCFSFFSEPGATVYQDIHLTDSSFLVGIQPLTISSRDLQVLCAPNPVVNSGTFYFTATNPYDAEILIYSVSGQLRLKLNIPPVVKGTISFSKSQLGSSGIYPYVVISKGKKISTGQIICQ